MDKDEIEIDVVKFEDFDRRSKEFYKETQLRLTLDAYRDQKELSCLLQDAAFLLDDNIARSHTTEVATFFKTSLTIAFQFLHRDMFYTTRHDDDSAIQRRNLELVELIVRVLRHGLLDENILKIMFHLFNPNSIFHHRRRVTGPPSYESVTTGQDKFKFVSGVSENTFLQDIIEKFGKLGGFQYANNQLASLRDGTLVAFFFQTFAEPTKMFSDHCSQFFLPMKDKLSEYLASLTDNEIKTLDLRSDAIGPITAITSYSHILAHFRASLKAVQLEHFNLLHRVLKLSTYNGRMFALNEIMNQLNLTKSIAYDHMLTAKESAEWTKDTLLPVMMRDSLHLKQYVERMSSVLIFMMEHDAFSTTDIDMIWRSKIGAHPAIILNIDDLLATIAERLDDSQLDHLLELFRQAWLRPDASKRDREQLLGLIRRLAEDVRMADKILNLLWRMATSVTISEEILNDTLQNLVKILEYRSSDKDQRKVKWLNRLADDFKKTGASITIPVIKLIELIGNHLPDVDVTHCKSITRKGALEQLERDEKLMNAMVLDLIKFTKPNPPHTIHGHLTEIQLRLTFIKYILSEGQLYLDYADAVLIWEHLICPGVPDVREIGFNWFKNIMGQEPDLSIKNIHKFFTKHMLTMDPESLTRAGVECFWFFFNQVTNPSVGIPELLPPAQNGINYLWKALCSCDEHIAPHVIPIIQNYYCNMVLTSVMRTHNDFFDECIQRIKSFHDTLAVVCTTEGGNDKSSTTVKVCRIIDLFQKYISEWPQNRAPDDALPLNRSWRGQRKCYTVQVEQTSYKVDLHTNATVRQLAACLKKQISKLQGDIQLLPEQNSQHILESEQLLESSAQPDPIHFFGKVVSERSKEKLFSERPDNALSNHPTFIFDIIKLMDLALEINAFSLVSSIMQLLLVLPGDFQKLRSAIMKKKDLTPFLDSSSSSTNWYNLLILRGLLLPSESQDREFLCQFFFTNGPEAIFRTLDLPRSKIIQTSKPQIEIHHLESFLEVLRFVTLVYTRSINQCGIWETLSCLDEYVYHTAASIPTKGALVNVQPHHIQGTYQICWKLSKATTDINLAETLHEAFKIGLESLSWLLVTNHICSFKRADNMVDNFFEFVTQMLFHQSAKYRTHTTMFLMVIYTKKYLPSLADQETTVRLAIHLYNQRALAEAQPEISEDYFSFQTELFNQFYFDSTLIHGLDRLKELIKWLEDKVGAKEANDVLLKGHLELCQVFVRAISHSELIEISDQLLRILTDIIFPVSPQDRREIRAARESGCDNGAIETVAGKGDTPMSPRKLGSPLCDTQATVHSAMNLLVEMTKGVPDNFQKLSVILKRNWHNQANLQQFDNFPTSQRKSKTGYVGLKNGGATCYLNAVVQQLFMVHPMKNALLSGQLSDPKTRKKEATTDRLYRYKIFNIFQRLIGHLSSSEQTFFVPRQFWDHVKLSGQHINVRDQQDAMEFYSQIVDTLDEAMKDDSEISAIQEYLGGTFSDQKICRDCPHRFSREEAFTSISVDVRSQHSLQESLAQFVKGDLLDGENSYYCETCDTKVAAIKRLCIARLPPYLCIQLKRFDYDWEREESIKFNDYFEFPRVLNMAPFTAAGIDADGSVSQNNYRLKGVVVHSGQASGGHYYSFVRESSEPNSKWLKFDDCDVTEMELSDEQLASECFGGDQGDFWDSRRNQSRRGRRWWNAYLLFYESIEETSVHELSQGLSDISVNSSTSESFCVPAIDRRQLPTTMPSHIKQEVEQQNAEMRHQRMMFSQEFIDFHMNLVHENYQKVREEWRQNGARIGTGLSDKTRTLAYWILDLGMSFLVNIASRLHQQYRKVNFLQSTEEISWHTIIKDLIVTDATLADSVLTYFTHDILRQYLFYCPNDDIRLFIAKIIALCCQRRCSQRERCLTDLIKISAPESRASAHISEQYFIILDILLRFPLLEGLSPPLFIFVDAGAIFNLLHLALQSDRYQTSYRNQASYAKLYLVLAQMCRHCDLVKLGCESKDNPYGIDITSHDKRHILKKPEFDREAIKVIENEKGANISTLIRLIKDSEKKGDDSAFQFTRFLLWNNKMISKYLADDIVWNMVFGNVAEISTFWSPLVYVYVTLDDTLTIARIKFILKSAHENGLLGIIEKVSLPNHRSNQHHIRIYQALKLVTDLMRQSGQVCNVITSHPEFSQTVRSGIRWLEEMLVDAQPGTSHDLNHGYDLMRTNSAENVCDVGISIVGNDEIETVSSTDTGTSESSTRYDPPSQ